MPKKIENINSEENNNLEYNSDLKTDLKTKNNNLNLEKFISEIKNSYKTSENLENNSENNNNSKKYQDKNFIKLLLSKKNLKNKETKKIENIPEKIIIKLINIQDSEKFNCLYKFKTKDITKNFNLEELIQELKNNIEFNFKNIILYTKTSEINLSYNNKNKSSLIYSKISSG